MSTIEVLLIVLALFSYILVVATHYSTAMKRIDQTGIRGTNWNYMDLIGFILSLPVTIAFCIVAIPFAILFAVAILFAYFTKADVWVVRLEDWLKKCGTRFTSWWTSVWLVKKLLQPIRKEEK